MNTTRTPAPLGTLPTESAVHPAPEAAPPSGLWRQKLVLAVVLNLAVAVPYYTAQHLSFRPAVILGPGPLERAVGFDSRGAWLYLSLYLLIPIGPLCMRAPSQLGDYARDILVIGLISNAVFFLCPTQVARPVAEAPDVAYRLIAGVDRPLNACPSLHASLAVYSALCWGSLRRSLWVGQAALWGWVLAILYATLLLKQHVLVDLLAGAALGAGIFTLSRLWVRLNSYRQREKRPTRSANRDVHSLGEWTPCPWPCSSSDGCQPTRGKE